MDKRQFLKTSGSILAGGMMSNLLSGKDSRTNWAGNYTYRAAKLVSLKQVSEVQAAVKSAKKVKALGSRHSFDSIADTPGEQISILDMREMSIDKASHTATVGGGVKYGDLAPYLDQHGYALHNLASLPHITAVGACQTGTHGSGVKNGNLSTAVRGFEMVAGTGEVVQFSPAHDPEHFQGAVVALGALGVVTKITLNLLPTFQMRQAVYENLSFDQLEHNLETIFASGYSVSLFTDWQNHRATQVWIKEKMTPGIKPYAPEFYGAKLATRKLHPLAGHSAENCTEQEGIPGPWYERMPHFRMNFTPSSGEELQSEFFVPRKRGYEAILAVEKLRDKITPHLFITELRAIAADDFWMSGCHQRDALAIHFTWKPEWPAVKNVLPLIEQTLAPFDPRPHWAKLFTLAPDKVQAQYPKLADFKKLVERYDPEAKFRNEFLERNLYS
jgi:alditol oxidase